MRLMALFIVLLFLKTLLKTLTRQGPPDVHKAANYQAHDLDSIPGTCIAEERTRSQSCPSTPHM